MPTDDRRRELQERARQVYGEGSDRLRFPTPAEAGAANLERERILAGIGPRASWSCRATKLVGGRLAPGCERCVEGTWSCLFVNERCNTRCFYCPVPQDSTGVPMTNTVPFPNPEEYVAYLERFGFRGVSLSGGEPLLDLDLSLRFIGAVKGRFGADVHLWLYTNGTLLDREVVRQLADAGLDEIRFDIGATGYRLDRVKLAVGVIEHVTVEIPAVPEERGRLEQTVAEMARVGVRHLNLHQLRLTPHNFSKLVDRGYTFLHGDNATVLESELTALHLVEHALDHGLDLPVHYCSYVYKDRFQRAAARSRSAPQVLRGHEDVTAAGFIRTLALRERPEAVAARAARLRSAGAPPERWAASGERLQFAAELWPLACPAPEPVTVAYVAPRILPSVSYRNPFVEVPLVRGRKIAVERIPSGPPLELRAEDAEALRRHLLEGVEPDRPACSDALRRALSHEEVEPGLQEYF